MPPSATQQLTFIEFAHLQQAGIDVSSHQGLPAESLRSIYSDVLSPIHAVPLPEVPLLHDGNAKSLLMNLSLIFHSTAATSNRKWNALTQIQGRMNLRTNDKKFIKAILDFRNTISDQSGQNQDFMSLDVAILVADIAQLVTPYEDYQAFNNNALQNQYIHVYDIYCLNLLFILGCEKLIPAHERGTWESLHREAVSIVQVVDHIATAAPRTKRKRRR